MATLILYPGKSHQSVIEVSHDVFRIGRAGNSHLQLNEEGISTNHAVIQKTPEGYLIKDMGSTNGLELNGQEVTSMPLRHNDIITLGAVEIRFCLEAHQVETPEYVTAEPIPSPHDQLGPQYPPQAIQSQPSEMVPYQGQNMAPAHYQAPMPGNYIPPSAPHIKSTGMLPLLAFLASITVIGFPLAFVLAIMSYVGLRKNGGTAQDQKLTYAALAISMISMLIISAISFFWFKGKNDETAQKETREQILDNEQRAQATLKSIASAQQYIKVIESLDQDGDGEGEYADLKTLVELSPPTLDLTMASGEAHGYSYSIMDVSETHWTAIAEPLKYDNTGLRSFQVDQTGQLRGDDLGGTSILNNSTAMPILPRQNNIYSALNEEIAGDVLAYLKTLPTTDHTLDKIERIAKRLSSDFAMTKVAQELSGVIDTTDHFMTERQGDLLYKSALTQLKEGEVNAAIASLQRVIKDYSGYSKIAEVEEQLRIIQSDYAQEREREAESLLAEAEQLERQGKQAEAQQIHRKITSLYAETETGLRISDSKDEMQRQVSEQKAETLFFDFMELNPVEEYQRVLSMSDQLDRSYFDTRIYGDNMDFIDNHRRKARAQKWRILTQSDLDEGATRRAQARLESAAREHPDLKLDLKDLFIEIYSKVGQRLADEQDHRSALRVYTELKQLVQGTTQSTLVPQALLSDLHYKVGYADFENGNYDDARWNLSNASEKHSKDAFFNIRLGSANLFTGRYQDAFQGFSNALKINQAMEQALLYRSYMNLRCIIYAEPYIANVFSSTGNTMPQTLERNSGFGGSDEEADDEMEEDEEEGENDDEKKENKKDDKKKSSSRSSNIASFDEFNSMMSEFKDEFSREIELPEYEDIANSEVPSPRDINIEIEYKYSTSTKILPVTIALIRKFMDARHQFEAQINNAKANSGATKDDARMANFVKLTQFRNQMSQVRILSDQDTTRRKKLFALLRNMEQRLIAADSDLRAAAQLKTEYKDLYLRTSPLIQAKLKLLSESTLAIKKDLERTAILQEKALSYAEQILREIQQDISSGLNIGTLVKELNRNASDQANLDRGILAMEKALKIEIPAEDIYWAASGRVREEQSFRGNGGF